MEESITLFPEIENVKPLTINGDPRMENLKCLSRVCICLYFIVCAMLTI